ncbi:MinD/ParA family ATP-binding protein [Cellulomonas palmilytica]|uniref:MinD/ParA family ATP-binding protein n=1 Tax=Cellulomonas palmilytica TaxID=2608402 RepID=UPI001F41663B|nr:chromosome partitioning protein [Cellulomonas palmilytica]UJP40875.1 chromosome partitioning protein [Cellulomonas palmilytica]
MSDTDSTTRIARLPQVTAEVRDDGTGQISVDGVIERIRMANLQEAGAAITERIAAIAGEVGAPVPVQVRDPDGMWSLLIHPDGLVDEAPADGAAVAATDEAGTLAEAALAAAEGVGTETPTALAAAPASGAAPGSAVDTGIVLPSPTAPGATGAGATAPGAPADLGATTVGGDLAGPAGAGVASPTTGPTTLTGAAAGGTTATSPTTSAVHEVERTSATLPTLDDLLAKRHQAATGPAEHGWRAGLRRVTFGGVKLGPGRAEQQRRVQTAAVRRTFDGPRTVVVLNPKGGAHKTTATMLLAATFGLQRGGYTLAWDNNETRGTLGWRSAHTDHQHTAVDLLQALPSLGGAATVRVGDLDGFVRTQTDEQFDVLASDESAASASSMDAASFAALHRVLSRFYRVLVIDTGNNMRASNWQAAIDAADQVVVVSTIREDTAQSAAWALDALRATGNDDAVRRAVTILSAPDRKIDKDLRKRLRSHFGALTRAVVEVPYDPSLVSGGPIAYESLRPATRDAWLRATAIVADGL